MTYNFDFEDLDNGWSGWYVRGGHTIIPSALHVRSGELSVTLQSSDSSEQPYGVLSKTIELPALYNGGRISVSVWVKTLGLDEGAASLFARFPGLNTPQSSAAISGNEEWTEYEITVEPSPDMMKHTIRSMVIGVRLDGDGKIWADDFKVVFEGLTPPPALDDHAFDNGSNLEFPDVTPELVAGLDLLGKVWGFVKYHHPDIAAGKYNWDYELLRMLPDYLAINDARARDLYLAEWIEGYGPARPSRKAEPVSKNAYIKPDLSWMEGDGIHPRLRKALVRIYENRNGGPHFYIGTGEAGEAGFRNENDYADMSYPDAGFRLLSLYRFWNIVRYFFPYTYQTDKEWNGVMAKYIPVFLGAADELDYELAVLRFMVELGDSHTFKGTGFDRLRKLQGDRYAPFDAVFIGDTLVAEKYPSKDIMPKGGPQPGDVITHIDGKAVSAILDSIAPYYVGSNDGSKKRDMARDMPRSAKATITVDFLSPEGSKRVVVPTYPERELAAFRPEGRIGYELLEGNIGYIAPGRLKASDIPEIKEQFKETRGIVVDLRQYPSTPIAYSLGSFFVDRPTDFVKFTNASVANPGEFTFTDCRRIHNNGPAYQGKVAVLVNENSQSQSEFTAMAFRAGANTTVVGSRTAGADGNITPVVLPGGIVTFFSGIGVYYPDGTPTQRVGIVPDIEVRRTIRGIREGRDELLDKAIEIIGRQ